VACLALVAATACSSGTKKATPSATVPTAPAQTTTTDPYAVPAVIDAAYVNRVLAGLDGIVGDLVRTVVTSKSIPPEVIQKLRAVYGKDDALQLEIDSFQDDMRRGFAGYKTTPGNKVSVVTHVITAKPSCIFAEIRRDYSAVSLQPNPDLQTQWVGLEPLDPLRDALRVNPTRWAYVYEGFSSSRTEPPNPCGS
jgi:hypothetical protein